MTNLFTDYFFIIVPRSSKGGSAQDAEEQVGLVQYEQENMVYFSASLVTSLCLPLVAMVRHQLNCLT